MFLLPKEMKALVSYGPHDYRFEYVNVPKISEEEILIKVDACGICAGDIKAYAGGEGFWCGTKPYFETPAISGHEFTGQIVAKGSKANADLCVGDKIAVEQIVPCNECYYCLRKMYTSCIKRNVYGFKYFLNGGFAEYAKIVKNSIVHKIPHDMPIEKSVLIEPLSCSMHAVDRALVTEEDNVVVSGAGPLGLGIISIASIIKPKTLTVLDLKENRLSTAKLLGCDYILNPLQVNVVEKVKEMTKGIGCDVYIEATGHPLSVIQGLEMVRNKARFVEFSLFNEPVTVNWSIIGDTKELDIYGVSLSPYTYPRVIKGLAEDKIRTDGIVTHKFKLEDFKEAFNLSSEGKDSIKVILIP